MLGVGGGWGPRRGGARAGAGAGGRDVGGGRGAGGEETKKDLEAEGAAVEYVQADLEKAADCRAVTAACDKIFGRVDGLVNAAGLTDRGTIENTTPEPWDRLLALNARAPFLLMQDARAIRRRTRVCAG